MSTPHEGSVEKLRRIRTFNQVFKYLVDERGWPLDTDTLDIDDLDALTYDWDPQELGIPVEALGSLERLRQMRPVTANQPWGVFFLEFSGTRLPITQVRKILRALVRKKRSTAGAGRPSWDLNDLLFIVSTGAAETVELHLIAFGGDNPATAEFRPLSWSKDTSEGHLRRLAAELLPYLDWPDDPTDVQSWRESWLEAFKLPMGEAIRDAARLAERMAKTARDLREQITRALRVEAGSGPFSTLLEEVRTQLVSDVDKDVFADMCAQTLTYGALSSRVTDPEGFGSSPILSTVPLANPFLEAFFEQVHAEAVAIDLPEGNVVAVAAWGPHWRREQSELIDLPGSGLDQLVADLRETNVEAILDQFGSTAQGGDPVIHFYEEFLKQYDRKMRADAGAFYTPQPVVEFMVRMVDEVLRTRFGLPLGVADGATWSEVADRNGLEVPEGIDPHKPFVSMIDPATGTGTFLVEWLRRARESFIADHPADDWPAHAREHVLPAMHAFENMLAPYTIAHLKGALELHDTGVSDSPIQVLLTDTLDHRPVEQKLTTMQDAIAAEGQRAAELKESERFTIVVGNPPYDREKREVGDSGKRKGGVVRYGAPGVAPRGLGRDPASHSSRARRQGPTRPVPLLDDITVPMRKAGLGIHIKNLYNDYVYFWRWAVWQATELPPGPGVVAFITASSYLDGDSMAGVPALLRVAFDELWIVDLGGEGRGARTEENVFDIRTPVAVAIGVSMGRTPDDQTQVTPAGECGHGALAGGGTRSTDGTAGPSPESHGDGTPADGCTVRYLRIAGSRADKLARLEEVGLGDVSQEVIGSGFDRLTPTSESDYFDWPEIVDIFPWTHSGCQLKRTWPIAETDTVLKQRWRELIEEVPRQRSALLKETRDRTTATTPLPLLNYGDRLRSVSRVDRGEEPESIEPYGYRSFDRQRVIADHRVGDYPKPSLWRVRGPRQVFLTSLTSTRLSRGPALTVSPYVPDLDHFRGSYGAKNVMPLYRDRTSRIPNIANGLLEAIGERVGAEVSPEDLLAYVHALASTAAFTECFDDELAEAAGPIHIPITTDRSLFQRAVELGRDLLWWHTWGERFAPAGQTNLPPGQAQQITAVEGMPEKYGYDPDTQLLTVGTGKFGPVSPEVWNFDVSGLKVVNSWLGYRMKKRKGRKSSPLDDIRPTRWTQTDELLRLLAILEHTIEVTLTAAALLDEILAKPLIPAAVLPKPTPDQRKPLKSP